MPIKKKKAAKKVAVKKLDKAKDIIKKYAELCKKINRYPIIREFEEYSKYSAFQIKYYHGNMSSLKDKARKEFPKKFSSLLDESLFNPKSIKALKKEIKGNERFVVTTAVTGMDVDRNFLKSIEKYCELENAKMLTIIASDPAAIGSPVIGNEFLDPNIPNESIVVSDVSLNSNLHISTIKLSAKHIDPVTSLTRIGQKDGSFIYASPKQRLKCVATGADKGTHVVMTTGAVTLPQYDSERYMSDRTAHIADHDHIMGALIIEVQDDKIYHFRQIQADGKGRFVDLGHRYSSEGKEEYAPEAFVLGDWHSGETDPIAAKCWKEVCKELKPKSLVLHDLFNGRSINHHESHNIISRTLNAEKGFLNLKDEITGVALDLNDLSSYVEKIVVVKSNHDEFLERYLKECRYKDDPHNHRLSLELALKLLDGEDPLKFACEKFGLENKDKIIWLQRDEDFEVGRVSLGSHGDKGANGAKGSIRTLESSHVNSVTGHSHTPQILRGAWVVGTSSYLKLDYNKGPSSWMHTSCLVYPNGSRQLINVIGGKWKLGSS